MQTLTKDQVYQLLTETFPDWEFVKDEHGWHPAVINCYLPDDDPLVGSFSGNLLFREHNGMIQIKCPCWKGISKRISERYAEPNPQDLKLQVAKVVDHRCSPWPG